eukprot:3505938-Alexandrium_andersonii.AAC.1
MSASLVGSEMCIRDSHSALWRVSECSAIRLELFAPLAPGPISATGLSSPCLLYTSDAADDM